MFKILKSRLLIFIIISLLMISPVAVMAAPESPGFLAQAKDFMFNKVGKFFGSMFGGESLSPIIISDNGTTIKVVAVPKTTTKKATTTKKTTVKKAAAAKKATTTTKKTSTTSVVTDSELKNIIRKEIAEILKMTGQIAIEETNLMRSYLKNYSGIKTLATKMASSSTSTDSNLSDSGYDYGAAITPSATFVLSSFSFLDSLNSLLHISASATPSSTAIPSNPSPSTYNVATSTEIVLPQATNNASSSENIISTSTEIISSSTESMATSTEAVDDVNNTPIQSEPLKLLISRLYVTGDNDLIELYNPMNVDIDLAAGNYRLEKTKTAVDPAILMRFGNLADGTYPGGTIIKSGTSYLIVRDKAEAALKDKAQAIATAKTFTLDSSGYTVYLGNDSISGPTDENIIDYLGYGTANFYEGLTPAPEILDNYILQRKTNNGLFVDTDNNGADFSLVLP